MVIFFLFLDSIKIRIILLEYVLGFFVVHWVIVLYFSVFVHEGSGCCLCSLAEVE